MLDTATLLPQMVASRAHQNPDSVYLEDVGARSATYAEVHQSALCWADALDKAGVKPGSVVATMLPTSIAYGELIIGLAWSAAIEMAVNTDFKGTMLAHVLNDSGAETIIISQKLLPHLATVDGQVDSLKRIIVVPYEGSDNQAPAGALWADDVLRGAVPTPRPGPTPHDLCWILYTSGTTGPSKGVMCTWTQTWRTVQGLPYRLDLLGPNDAVYSPLPMFHQLGRHALYLMASCGGRCVLREKFTVNRYWDDVRNYHCSLGMLVSAMAAFLMSAPPSERDRDNPMKQLGVAPLLAGQTAEMADRFDVQIGTAYNMTELSVPLCFKPGEVANDSSCGRARHGYELRLADDDDEEVPTGTAGQLLVRCDEPGALMAGYWRHPEKTVEAWRNLWFHTGDVLRRDEDGNYYFVDRAKDALRRRGENISSVEVEREIVSHPAVAEAAVFGVPSQHTEDEVMACLVFVADQTLDLGQLWEYLEARLPGFMIPRYLEVLDRLPKTAATMRVEKQQLRERGVTKATYDRRATASSAPAAR